MKEPFKCYYSSGFGEHKNYFFRIMQPYCVECKEGFIFIENREYEILFKGILPKNFDINRLMLSEVNSNIEGLKDDANRIWLYNDGTNPTNNTKGYDKKLMDVYLKRLSVLDSFLVGIVPCEISESDGKIPQYYDYKNMK